MTEAELPFVRARSKEEAAAHVRRILSEVCAKYNLPASHLLGPRRSRVLSQPRQEVMWRAYKETAASFPQIGEVLGGRDHTTIMHGVKQHERRMSETPISTLSTNCHCPEESSP